MGAPEKPPGGLVHPARRTVRYWASRVVVWMLVRALFRVELRGADRLPAEPAVYCFNHLNWIDPFALMDVLPIRPRLFFFGPREEDMGRGLRNRLMVWSGAAIPYKPGKNDLLEATRRTSAVFRAGGVLAIAGEGRIHARDDELLPLNEGAAYFALRSGVPLVPVAIRGTSWLRFGRRIEVSVGEPLLPAGRPTRESVETMTEAAWQALHALVADAPTLGRPGRFGQWLTELFNDWPEGSREATLAATATWHAAGADRAARGALSTELRPFDGTPVAAPGAPPTPV
jgi:1-acyl-sn-glycerol-3-phosphate acyltransferase